MTYPVLCGPPQAGNRRGSPLLRTAIAMSAPVTPADLLFGRGSGGCPPGERSPGPASTPTDPTPRSTPVPTPAHPTPRAIRVRRSPR
ncbi:hypothetical protein EDD92_4099 [Streptomyces sp. TLI_185]|nr:hypothetical protein EDD92_4099 [Streptomyces sp. TLI_185]